LKVLVQNQTVSLAEFFDPQIMERFRAFLSNEEAKPLQHQAKAFREILSGRAVRLEAGTASGKTLSVALPLFEKLERGEARKLLFLYPTLALMEDQRRVMDRLAEVYGLEEPSVGTIRGGMSRSSVVAALGKKIIVATPDAVYWFLRKNVKYSHLLIYGLLLADEIVVDEAHLFAGLPAQSLTAFLDRLRTLRERYIGEPSKVHVLTATWPDDGTLDGLNPDAIPISGSSLVGDVNLEVSRADDPAEHSQALVQGCIELFEAGCEKVLLVSNSARSAHIAFDGITGSGKEARRLEEVPDDFKLSFGSIDVFEAMKIADKAGLGELAVDALRREVPLAVRRLQRSIVVGVREEVIARAYGELLERKVREIKSELWKATRSEAASYGSLRAKLSQNQRTILDELHVDNGADYTAIKDTLESWAGRVQEVVEAKLLQSEGEEGVRLTLPKMPELEDLLGRLPLARDFSRELRRNFVLEGEALANAQGIPVEAYRRIRLSVARFMSWFGEQDRERLKQGVIEKAEHRAVGKIKGRDDGALAVLYSGSMPRHAREGLIPLFDKLRVPVMLVSTSAVEVGVDFGADGLVTEECSGSSFLQRFGRVGRRGDGARAKLILRAASHSSFVDGVGNRTVIERGEFSEIVKSALPKPIFLRESQYVDAVQSSVTRQLGEVGKELTSPDEMVENLAGELRSAEVELAYGLRSTMPGVQLRGGVSKSPFYALRFADCERLFSPESPFELARLDRAFEEIIYTSREDQRDVFVDLQRTWPLVRSMAYLNRAGELRMTRLPGAWSDLNGFLNTLRVVNSIKKDSLPQELLDAVCEHDSLPSGALARPDAMLFYGDVALSWRASQMPDSPEIVPYRLRDQWMLLLPSWEGEEVGALLSKHGAENLEGLFYDHDGLRHGNGCAGRAVGLVILEEQAGACLALWERLVRG
jgi:DEAD/DEAH box helicase domain-containing protein